MGVGDYEWWLRVVKKEKQREIITKKITIERCTRKIDEFGG